MSFHSILYERPQVVPPEEPAQAPAFFPDLNLDQVVARITAGRDEYQLTPFFYSPLKDVAQITYRQEVMRDLESGLSASMQSFSRRMAQTRAALAAVEKLPYKEQKEWWFLHAVEQYCQAVAGLHDELAVKTPSSRGLQAFSEYLAAYAAGERFQALRREVAALRSALSAIRYCVVIRTGAVTVRPYEGEPDYSAVVAETFARFRHGDAPLPGLSQPAFSPGMNHIEAAVLERVARLYPETFRALEDFCLAHGDFLEQTIAEFDREIQFYLAYLEHMGSLRRAGLTFCYPELTTDDKQVSSRGSFDLALAGKLVSQDRTVVCNDFHLQGEERLLVVTGPNQGGKTTFARAFGQLHYLASLGCPVPGTQARLFLFDRLFTHFERENVAALGRGNLQDDLARIHHILTEATPRSIVIINEIFSSTTARDAVQLGRKVMASLLQLDVIAVCVTFLDELASLNKKTVSMVAGVLPADPTVRTFRMERRPADGRAYALAIASKYGLTYEQLKERIAQ